MTELSPLIVYSFPSKVDIEMHKKGKLDFGTEDLPKFFKSLRKHAYSNI